MLSILGGGVGKNFDISKCKYEKIIIMTDADYDLFIYYFRLPVEFQTGKRKRLFPYGNLYSGTD